MTRKEEFPWAMAQLTSQPPQKEKGHLVWECCQAGKGKGSGPVPVSGNAYQVKPNLN